MVVLDTLPAGLLQFDAVLEHGLWFARSQEWIGAAPFQTLTWLRLVGGAIFVLGGVIPLAWFCLARARAAKVLTAPATAADPLRHVPEPVDLNPV